MKNNELLSICVLMFLISTIMLAGAWLKVSSYRRGSFECQEACGSADSYRIGGVCYCASAPWTPSKEWGAHD